MWRGLRTASFGTKTRRRTEGDGDSGSKVCPKKIGSIGKTIRLGSRNNCAVSRETMTKEEEYEYWARLVREVQRYSGMTMQELANKLGVSLRDVVYWKSGERRPMGFVAVRFFELRRDIILRTTVRIQVTGESTLS